MEKAFYDLKFFRHQAYWTIVKKVRTFVLKYKKHKDKSIQINFIVLSIIYYRFKYIINASVSNQ